MMTFNTTHEESGVHRSPEHDRRVGSRVWVDLPVDVLVDGFTHRCRVIDVSLTGMVVHLTRALAVRESSLFGTYAIHASGLGAVRVAARTVWRRGAMQAARFVAMPSDERRAIVEMVTTAHRRASEGIRLELAERRDRGI